MLTESRYTAMGTSLGQSDSIAVSMALTLPASPSQSKPDGFASSPKGGATGVPVAALRTEQCLRSAGTAVLRSHWQQLRQGFVESSCESRQQGPALCAKLGPSGQYGLPGLPMALPLGELARSA